MAASRFVRLRLRGTERDNGDVHLADFIDQLRDFLTALKETDRVVNGGSTLYFRVAGLTHNSPAEVTIEAVPRQPNGPPPEETTGAFLEAVETILGGKPVPDRFDYAALQAYKKMASTRKGRIAETAVLLNGSTEVLGADFGDRIEKVLGKTHYALGSLTGRLEGINIHDKRVFTIYPLIGPSSVPCVFPDYMLDETRGALGMKVSVFGTMKYRQRSPYPVEMTAERLEVRNTSSAKLSDLAGIAPDATGDMSSEDFVRWLRVD